MLLALGADKDATVDGGRTALHWACQEGQQEVVLHLAKELGANFEATTQVLSCNGRCMWHHDCVPINSQGGMRPLHYACGGGHLAIVKLLVELGADTQAKTMHGHDSALLARMRGKKTAVQWLSALKTVSTAASEGSNSNEEATTSHSAAPPAIETVRQSGEAPTSVVRESEEQPQPENAESKIVEEEIIPYLPQLQSEENGEV